MQIIDLYEEYEGYLEICITEETDLSQEIFQVRLLEFHFNEVLTLIPLGQYNINSVMYNYFRSEGWHDGKWECTGIQEFYDQLVAINTSVPAKYMEVHNALTEICLSTLKNANKLYIELI